MKVKSHGADRFAPYSQNLGGNNSQYTVWGYNRDSLLLSTNWGYNRKRKTWNGGGNFYVRHRKVEVQVSKPISYTHSLGPAFGWSSRMTPNGGFLTTKPGVDVLPRWEDEMTLLKPKGATGWARARPGNPEADLFQFIAELRDIPSIPLRLMARTKKLASVGSEYLNVQFGWVPLLKDLRKMYELYHNIDKRLAQLVKDNGKGIRRRRSLGESINTTSTTLYTGNQFGTAFFGGPGNVPGFNTGVCTLVKHTKTYEKFWFAGRFRYYVPDIGSSQWTRRATAALFGINPTPAAIWAVLPWSWLVDWFSNVGDIMTNLSSNAVDNLTADYAFVMRTYEVATEWHAVGQWPGIQQTTGYRVEPGSLGLVNRDSTVTKSRMAASPYGFGVDFNGLSGYQASILAALGISRSRF